MAIAKMPALVDHSCPPLKRLWWLQPAWLFAVVIGGTIAVAAIQDDRAYRLYGSPKYISAEHVVLAAVAIVVFALGGRLAESTGRLPQPAGSECDRIIRTWFFLTTCLTFFGYAVWLAVGYRNGFRLSTFREFLVTDDRLLAEAMRDEYFRTISGVTTCTQFAVAAVPLGMWLYSVDIAARSCPLRYLSYWRLFGRSPSASG
jgi:hypothetical protein